MTSGEGFDSRLAGRFSPTAFDPTASMSAAEVDLLLDAARAAPSAGNSQPWRFIVGVRGGAVHSRIVAHLAGSALRWAPDASLLVLNLAQIYVEDTDWEFSEFARYDLGQAVAHMTIQGLSMGYAAHQFRAFDRAGLQAEFAVPREWEVTSAIAFGVPAHRCGEPTEPGTSRERNSRDEVTWARG